MNFRSHILSGFFVGIFFSFFLFLLDNNFSFFLFFPLFAGVFGAVLPDIDHHSSIPFRFLKFFVFFSVLIVSFNIFFDSGNEVLKQFLEEVVLFFSGFMGDYIEENAIKILVCFLFSVASGLLSVLLLKILRPKHRGVTHKKTFGVLLGVFLFLLFYFTTQDENFSMVMGFSLTAGFFSHLLLDGVLIK